MDVAKIIENIELRCKEKNIKMSTLLKLSGLTSHLFSDWKSQKSSPSISALEKMCAFLDVALGELFKDDNQKLTLSQERLLEEWRGLSSCEKEALYIYIQAMKSNLKS